MRSIQKSIKQKVGNFPVKTYLKWESASHEWPTHEELTLKKMGVPSSWGMYSWVTYSPKRFRLLNSKLLIDTWKGLLIEHGVSDDNKERKCFWQQTSSEILKTTLSCLQFSKKVGLNNSSAWKHPGGFIFQNGLHFA